MDGCWIIKQSESKVYEISEAVKSSSGILIK